MANTSVNSGISHKSPSDLSRDKTGMIESIAPEPIRFTKLGAERMATTSSIGFLQKNRSQPRVRIERSRSSTGGNRGFLSRFPNDFVE